MDALLAFGFGYQEMIIVLFIALLLFGKRLPEVARNMGKGLTEFKKGMRGIEDDVHNATSYDSGPTADRPYADDDLENVSAPKFEPPTTGDAPTDTGDAPADTGDAPADTGDAPADTKDDGDADNAPPPGTYEADFGSRP